MLTRVPNTTEIFSKIPLGSNSYVYSNFDCGRIGSVFSFFVKLLSEIDFHRGCSQRLSFRDVTVISYRNTKLFFTRVDVEGVMTLYIPPKTSVFAKKLLISGTKKHELGVVVDGSTAVVTHRISNDLMFSPVVMLDLPDLGLISYIPLKIADPESENFTASRYHLENIQELLVDIFPNWSGLLSVASLSVNIKIHDFHSVLGLFLVCIFKEIKIKKCETDACGNVVEKPRLIPPAAVTANFLSKNFPFVFSKNTSFLCSAVCIPQNINRLNDPSFVHFVRFDDQELNATSILVNRIWQSFYRLIDETYEKYMMNISLFVEMAKPLFLSGTLSEKDILDLLGANNYENGSFYQTLALLYDELFDALETINNLSKRAR